MPAAAVVLNPWLREQWEFSEEASQGSQKPFIIQCLWNSKLQIHLASWRFGSNLCLDFDHVLVAILLKNALRILKKKKKKSIWSQTVTWLSKSVSFRPRQSWFISSADPVLIPDIKWKFPLRLAIFLLSRIGRKYNSCPPPRVNWKLHQINSKRDIWTLHLGK